METSEDRENIHPKFHKAEVVFVCSVFLFITIGITLFVGFDVTVSMPDTITVINNEELLDTLNLEEVYLVTILISHSEAWFDSSQIHEIQETKITIPVVREWFDLVNIGDVINDGFRWGDYFIEGSAENLHVQITDKKVLTR